MRSLTSGAMSLRRAVRRSCGLNPLIERSSTKIASIFWTASKAIGEIIGFVLPRTVEAISASSKNLRLAWTLCRARHKSHYLEHSFMWSGCGEADFRRRNRMMPARRTPHNARRRVDVTDAPGADIADPAANAVEHRGVHCQPGV